MLRRILEAVLLGAGVAFGVYIAGELQRPYSDLRLRLDELAERVKGATS